MCYGKHWKNTVRSTTGDSTAWLRQEVRQSRSSNAFPAGAWWKDLTNSCPRSTSSIAEVGILAFLDFLSCASPVQSDDGIVSVALDLSNTGLSKDVDLLHATLREANDDSHGSDIKASICSSSTINPSCSSTGVCLGL